MHNVAFPGGTKEEYDADLWQTALREAHEEVGLKPELIKYVGQLSPVYIPPSNFWVQPYIGVSESNQEVIIQKEEIQLSFDTNIRLLLEPTIKQEKLLMRPGFTEGLKTPYYNIEGHTVWGATAMMLSELEELLRRVYKRF